MPTGRHKSPRSFEGEGERFTTFNRSQRHIYEYIMKLVTIHNLTRPKPQPLVARYCDSFLCRLRGLTFRRKLPDNWGLLLVQSRDSRVDSSIHMLAMWIDLAVVWITDNGEVVDVRLARRWRLAYFPKRPARYVLEMAVEHLEDFHDGDQVRFEETHPA
jgi:uncharacterized membrane protein (UPF0127 family)